MGKKSFEAGMAAGVKPVGKKLDQLGQEVEGMRVQQDEVAQKVSILGEDIEAKDKLRQLGLENYHDLTELEGNERVILMSLLYWLARQEEPSDAQKKYLSSLQRFVGVLSVPRDNLPLDALQNIMDIDVHKVFLKIVLEYIYLRAQDWVCSEAEQEVIEGFEVGKRTQETIKASIEEEFRILGGDGLAQKYDIRVIPQDEPEKTPADGETISTIEEDTIRQTQSYVVVDFYSKDAAPIKQKIIEMLKASGLEYTTTVPENYEDCGIFLCCYRLKDYLESRRSETKHEETIFDQYGCFIGRCGDIIDVIFDEKYDLNVDNHFEEFLKFYIDTCHDLPSFDVTIEESKRLLCSIEEQKKLTESDGRFSKYFDEAKKGVSEPRDEMEQKIVGQDKDNLLRKSGGSIFGMLSAVPTSLLTAGLNAGKIMTKSTKSVSTGVIGAAQAKTFEIKYKKKMQHDILVTKLVEYLVTSKEDNTENAT